ncbi:MAG: chorismate mutase [Oscillospiraceae bacterium]|nr:chorismate mutase [Oscillospiraceae bacterium]MDD6503241.1 prephenate dehydratase domain-containing protein [Oscillospiraceae bacterium]MDY4105813.1 prephenate dehydratase domain-containing protein [Oscillospiraceae bacterium]
MDINELRSQIDGVDKQIIELFRQRQAISENIAAYKLAAGKPIYDPERERKKLVEVAGLAGEDLRTGAIMLFSTLFDLSSTRQMQVMNKTSDLAQRITAAIENTPKQFPQYPIVACQGVEGAYSQIACEKIFRTPNIMYFQNFEGVFAAIENGLCEYGVLPIENSTAGSVNRIYDLMAQHNCYVVRSARLKVDHSLLAKKGTKLSDIKEIFSHEQAINQCAGFLKTLPGVKVTVVENTAMAAKMVAESERTDVAALSSHSCASLYGLDCLASSVQDKGNNFTRFICISKNLEIYPGADRTSIMCVVPHRPGSLFKVLSRFFALGINLVKLESRPIPDRDFEYMMYFDFDTPLYSKEFVQVISELETMCEEFRYFGSYSEIV